MDIDLEDVFNMILWAIVAGVVFILIDIALCTSEVYTGIVLDKQYAASHTTTGTGIANTSNGPTVVTTTEHEPEKFLLMVKSARGEVLTAKCEPELYYKKSIGSPLIYTVSSGKFTGWAYSINGKN